MSDDLLRQLKLNGSPPVHVAIIMDGNGRWAAARGLPRTAGHQAGADAVRRIVAAAPALGIRTLTLYAFSADNWQRPSGEVAALMEIFARQLRGELAECCRHEVRLRVIGRRDRLPLALRAAIARAERSTAAGRTLDLRIAIDYSARDAILQAARQVAGGLSASEPLTRQRFASCLGSATHAPGPSPDVDLLIRTGGERRLSDFLLWEAAYAELLFTDRPWPEFGPPDLADAVAEFRRRDRRFGRVAEEGAS